MAVTRAVLIMLFLFTVNAQDQCKSPVALKGPSGSIATTNPYINYQKCRWTISVEAGKVIELSFNGRFDIENEKNCKYDHVIIYDTVEAVEQVSKNSVCSSGSLSLAGKLGPLCGFEKPDLEKLISSGNQVVIEFCSDSENTGSGLDISYREIVPVAPTSFESTCQETVVVDGSHNLTFYNNAELPSFLECSYTYTSKNGKPLKVTATKFSLEGIIGCRYDSLKIFDGPNSDSPILGTFCGVNGPKNVRSSQPNLYLTLTSDQYTNGKGIALTIEETCLGTHLCSAKSDVGDVCYSDQQTCNRNSECPDGQDESFCKEDCGAFDTWQVGQPFPGAAAITHIDGQIHCGGALINNQYVLTTAHCFHRLDDKPERFVVKLGAARLAEAYVAQIDQVTVHPQFNPKTLANNLALVRLTVPAPLQKSIAPFCHPSAQSDASTLAVGTVCYTLGWGRTVANDINSYASSVKQFTATIQNNSKCKYSGSPVIVDNKSVCADTSGRLCYGDNGAPLVCKAKNGKWHVAGINSVAFSCTQSAFAAKLPSAFVKVSAYSDWIVNGAFAKK